MDELRGGVGCTNGLVPDVTSDPFISWSHKCGSKGIALHYLIIDLFLMPLNANLLADGRGLDHTLLYHLPILHNRNFWDQF